MSAFFCFLLNIAPGLFSRATGLLTTPRDSKRGQKSFRGWKKFEQKQRKENFESKFGSKLTKTKEKKRKKLQNLLNLKKEKVRSEKVKIFRKLKRKRKKNLPPIA
jgi:hypothetical protein